MDPNQLAADIMADLEHLQGDDVTETRDLISRVEDLISWLDSGGFVPSNADDLVIELHDWGLILTASDLKDALNERRG